MTIAMSSWVGRHAERTPEHVALRDKERRITYRELHGRVQDVAAGLAELGVRKGDRVAALLLNCAELLELLLACTHLGAIFTPLNFRLAAEEVEFILNDATPEVLAYHPAFAPMVEAVRARVPVRHYVSVAREPMKGALPYAEMHAGKWARPPTVVGENEPALMMYTSGTTGKPKGALLSHGNLLWNDVQTLASAPVHDEDVNYAVAPLFHIGGLNVLTGPFLYRGCQSIIDDKFDPLQALEAIQREKITCSFMVPAMWGAMAAHPRFQEFDVSSIRYAIVGGAPCPMPVLEAWQRRGVNFQEGFGLTETSPLVCLLAARDAVRKNGAVGYPAMHVEVRLVDESDRDVPPGEIGELIVRGPNVMIGYWNRPEETATALRGGWFHTGDLARRDDEGFLTIVDRKKDMVITGGENVYPVEVEQVLVRHPAIAEVSVIGIPHDKWGEAVIAVAALKAGQSLTLEDLLGYCEGKLARYKRPSALHVVDALPRNATGKVLKTELRRHFGGTATSVTR